MGNNAVLGIYRCKIGGKPYTLLFTWKELEELETEYGASGPPCGDLQHLNKIAATGFRAYHPELTADVVREMNMPPLALQGHVMAAMRLAYYGTDTPEQIESAATGEKKKVNLWRRFTRWLSALAYRPANSGP